MYLLCGLFEVIRRVKDWQPVRPCPICDAVSPQAFQSSARVTKLHDRVALNSEIERRSVEHGRRTHSDNVERLLSREDAGQGNMYNPKAQERAMLKRGIKLK